MIQNALIDQKCRNHALREAVARCRQCRYFFCRECISEHEDRSICALCLGKLTQSGKKKEKAFRSIVISTLGSVAGFLILWLFFYLIGYVLVSLPSSFHEGTIWKANVENEKQME